MWATGFQGYQLCSVQAVHPGNVKASWETKCVLEMHANFVEILIADIIKIMECLILDSPPDQDLLKVPKSRCVKCFAKWQVYF